MSLPPSRFAKVLSPKPFVDDVAQQLDLTQLDHERAQLRGSPSLDLPSGQAGTDSRATKRAPSHLLLTFLSTRQDLGLAPMLQCLNKTLMTESLLLSLEMEDSHRIYQLSTPSSPPSFKSGLRAALPTGMRVGREQVTLTAVQHLSAPRTQAIPPPLSFSDYFLRSTMRSGNAKLRSRDAEPRSVHAGMISAHAFVRSKRSITALTPSRKRSSHHFLPLRGQAS